MRLPRGGILRRCMPTHRLARGGPRGEARAHLRGGGRTNGGKERLEGGPRGPAPRVDSRYTAATSVSAMSARSDFHNAALYSPTLKESHALTSSSSMRHGAARRTPEWAKEREREESVRASVFTRPTSERAGERPRASRDRGSFCLRDGAYRRLWISVKSLLIVPQPRRKQR